jgi:hypothetical protein
MESRADKPIDAVWLLYVLQGAAPVHGRTKLQKTTFLVAERLRDHSLVGPHFRFIRYANGPFSRQLWDTYDDLAARGFVRKSGFELTDRGRFLLELAIPPLKAMRGNRRIFRVADETLAWCKKRHGSSLMNYVYGLQVVPDEQPEKPMKVADIPLGVGIINRPVGGLDVPQDLQLLIEEELNLTEEELADARRRLPEIERRAIRNLSEGLSEARPA